MSIKSFHIFFISISALTLGIIAAWSWNEFATEGASGMLLLGLLCAVLGVGLVAYGRTFRRKIKNIVGDSTRR